MQLYTLTRSFFPKDFISEFTSVIWTERYSSAGDVQLVVKPIPSMIEALTPGTLLGLRGVQEIMQVETQSIENGLMTVTGSSLVKFLNERAAWFPNTEYTGADTSVRLSADYSSTNTVGQFLADVVNAMAVNPAHFVSYWAPISLDGANDKIPGLSVGRIDPNGTPKLLSMPTGPLYDGIASVAAAEAEGFKLYLESAQYRAGTFVLKFATYRGKDRTSDQTTNLMVRFSPKLDSLTNVKEMSSFADYKNVVYVFYKNQVSIHHIPTLVTAPIGFDRRALMVEAPDIYLDPAHIAAFRDQVARDALANHLYIQAVDGQVSSKNDYVFGTDYYLGDIIELEGFSGLITKARITEYIRSQDQFGEQEYPTLSVIDPLGTNYIPDTEPGVYEPPWEGEDPSWGDDWTPPDLTDPGLDPRINRPPPIPNPGDPFDYNPDPVPDFGPDDGGTGGDSDTGGDRGLTPGTIFGGTDWLYDTSFGYYIHSGIVYVAGEATADGYDYFGSDRLLAGITPDLAPATPVSGKVLIDHVNSSTEYAYDSGLSIGPWLDVTIDPDGTVTLDAGNPFRPVDNNEDFGQLVLILSSLSWPTSASIPDTYSPTGSLDDYIATAARIGTGQPAWANVDGSYTAHGSRMHLKGKIKAADLAAQYDPLYEIPPEYQPRLGSPSAHRWCEVPQKDGYRFTIDTPDGRNHSLRGSSGSQNPQSVGNNGCGIYKYLFNARNSDGFLARGSKPPLVFTPGTHDVGLSWDTYSGTPIGALPPSADWRGNSFNVRFQFALEDLIPMGIFEPTGEFNWREIDGPDQVAFVVGMSPPGAPFPDGNNYYKIQVAREGYIGETPPPGAEIKLGLFLVQAGGEPLFKTDVGFAYPPRRPDGTYRLGFTFMVSTDPGDIGATATGGRDFYSFGAGAAADIGLTFDGDWTNPVKGCKTPLGVHFPPGSSTIKVISVDIHGIGDFPRHAPDDEIDLTGSGWPIL